MPVETLTKIDVARCQLDTAISLWFRDDDPVSAHTLACSSHEIVQGLNHHRRGPKLLFDSLWFKDEYRSRVIAHFKREYNFFKHADRDPEVSIHFDTEITSTFLFVACWGMKLIGVTPTAHQQIFLIYYVTLRPEYLTEEGRTFFDTIPIQTIEDVKTVPKKEFFEAFNHFLTKQ
jgi:hypothetical protein